MNFSPDVDFHSWVVKGRHDVVYRDRVEGIGGIAADIRNHAKLTGFARGLDRVVCNEGRDRRGEIDAVDENIH